jgi:hypothetical protein
MEPLYFSPVLNNSELVRRRVLRFELAVEQMQLVPTNKIAR